jgi:hypothetical protein
MAIECQIGDSVYSSPLVVFDPWIKKLYSFRGVDLAYLDSKGWHQQGGDPILPPRFGPSGEDDEIVLVAKQEGAVTGIARSQVGFSLLYDDEVNIYLVIDLASGEEVSQGYRDNWWLPGNEENSRLYINQSVSTGWHWNEKAFRPGLRERLSALAERI